MMITKLNLPELHLLTNYEIMPPMSSKVKFFFDEVKINIKKRKELKYFIEFIFKNEHKSLGLINYIFCTDNKLLLINREYLKHDYLTDIITFDLSEKGKPIIADIYISTDRVKENAIELSDPFMLELCRVIFHGALHLCGYNDKTTLDKKKMRMIENYYLKKFTG
jgi:rRNA maturation RNase YbeY